MRGFLSIITVLAFCLSVLLPSLVVSSQALAHTSEAGIFGGKVLICTPDGLKWVNPSDSASEQNEDVPSKDHTRMCVLCFVCTKHFENAIKPFGNTVLLGLPLEANFTPHIRNDITPFDNTHFKKLSRAPPSI